MQLSIQVLVHCFCLGLYLIPIFKPNEYGGPTLDELHIMSPSNSDIHGSSTMLQIFSNDYWGRPMMSESSHKSWRPLTVLSFRYLKGVSIGDQLTMHRCVNVITHAAVAEVVGILSTRLFPFQNNLFLLRMITKVVFCLHGSHVEVTCNAANRNHILAVFFSTMLCDPFCPLLLAVIALVGGFLCSETFLFQVPAAAVTLVVLKNYTKRKPISPDSRGQSVSAVFVEYLSSALSVAPRLILMITAMFLYLGGRYYFDTLDIPEGLIRPAENPFYHFHGQHRVRNYLYVLAVHIAKSWGFDPIGFSHEYGYDCVPALESWTDPRLALPLLIAVLLCICVVLSLRYPRQLLGPVSIHFAWLMTLFPISGLVKVGTFISDRIVVASTVSVCLWIGLAVHYWVTRGIHMLPAKPLQCAFVAWVFLLCTARVHTRTLEWMDSVSLLESALKVCPRFAKAHMEMSKVYSGLFPNLHDLGMARHHLDIAREIDPELCDTHLQYSYLSFQEGKYLEYESELVEAILCPFTMGGAIEMWHQYWPAALNSAATESERLQIQRRQDEYSRVIQERAQLQKEAEKE